MAQKKITDLQLIDAVVAGLNFPGDDGIQTYRATAAQIKAYILATGNIELAMLAVDIFNGLTSVSAADDDYFTLIDTSDSNKTKKALVSTFARNLYRTVSSYPATVASTDGTLKLTSTSGTITLPANGSPGKRYKFMHQGTSFTNVYTIATTGGAVFKTPAGDVASGDWKLHTLGQVVEFEDDGTNWLQVHHYAKTGWIDMGAITVGAVTTGPAKATTRVQDKIYGRRDGDEMEFRFEYLHTASAGATAGSGDYLYTLPNSLQFGPLIRFSTSTIADINAVDWADKGFGVASFETTAGNSGMLPQAVLPYDATRFRLMAADDYTARGPQDSAFFHYSYAARFGWSCQFKVQISGLMP